MFVDCFDVRTSKYPAFLAESSPTIGLCANSGLGSLAGRNRNQWFWANSDARSRTRRRPDPLSASPAFVIKIATRGEHQQACCRRHKASS